LPRTRLVVSALAPLAHPLPLPRIRDSRRAYGVSFFCATQYNLSMPTISPVFSLHAKHTGKIGVHSEIRVRTRKQLSLVYTPHVADVCRAIADNEALAKTYTMAGKMVAVISDGSAVLGLGNIGAKAALPVMEGKCVIFKELAGVDAFPICLDEQDPNRLIAIIKTLAPNFAAINLEDISAPRCFDIEEALSRDLDIPVMHDDQHGTAIVVLAGLLGAAELVPKRSLRIVIVGAGAAGHAITRLLLHETVRDELHIEDVKVVDSKGVLSGDRADIDPYKQQLAQLTAQKTTMSLDAALAGADVFIGVSGPGVLAAASIKGMRPDPIIFALANPTPEIMPDEAYAVGAALVATGRSDFPNQINNALAYPGVFKGLIASGATSVTTDMKIAAARALFLSHQKRLGPQRLLPSVLDTHVPNVIAQAIMHHA
jgi:malate dehydrogenase (oxaloacetate-decarboxylating)